MTDAAKDLDLSILSPDYRAAFEALQATAARVAELEEINKRLEHLVAELNHVVHGKRSEKLSADERPSAIAATCPRICRGSSGSSSPIA